MKTAMEKNTGHAAHAAIHTLALHTHTCLYMHYNTYIHTYIHTCIHARTTSAKWTRERRSLWGFSNSSEMDSSPLLASACMRAFSSICLITSTFLRPSGREIAYVVLKDERNLSLSLFLCLSLQLSLSHTLCLSVSLSLSVHKSFIFNLFAFLPSICSHATLSKGTASNASEWKNKHRSELEHCRFRHTRI